MYLKKMTMLHHTRGVECIRPGSNSKDQVVMIDCKFAISIHVRSSITSTVNFIIYRTLFYGSKSSPVYLKFDLKFELIPDWSEIY